MKGTIRSVKENGFGFITPENGGKDVFFHATSCTNGDFKEMKEGDVVSFEMGQSDRGPVATDVVRG